MLINIFKLFLKKYGYFSGGAVVKNQPASAGDPGSVPGCEDPLQNEIATHSSILAWKTPGMEDPGGL